MAAEKEKKTLLDLFEHMQNKERKAEYGIFAKKAMECLREIESSESLLYFYFDMPKTDYFYEKMRFRYGSFKGEVRLFNDFDDFHLFIFEGHNLTDKIKFDTEASRDEILENLTLFFKNFIKKKRLGTLFSKSNPFFFSYVLDWNDFRHRFGPDFLEEIEKQTSILYGSKREEAHAKLAKNIRDTGKTRKLKISHFGMYFEVHRLAEHYMILYYEVKEERYRLEFFPLDEKEKAILTMKEKAQEFILSEIMNKESKFNEEDTDI